MDGWCGDARFKVDGRPPPLRRRVHNTCRSWEQRVELHREPSAPQRWAPVTHGKSEERESCCSQHGDGDGALMHGVCVVWHGKVGI
jgi:hypothetical protein